MKRIFKTSTIILLLTATCGLTRGQTKIGIQAGVNFSGVSKEKESGGKESTSSIAGMRIGFTADFPVSGDFYVQPGLFYSKKGYKQKEGGYYGLASNFKVLVNYIDLPIHLLYKPKFGNGNLLLGAGPYLGYGRNGSWESDNVILIGDIMTDTKGTAILKNDYSDGEFGTYMYGRPWDYGASFLAGYEFKGVLSLQVNALVGLANLQPKSGGESRDGSLKNNAVGLTVGYKF